MGNSQTVEKATFAAKKSAVKSAIANVQPAPTI